MSEPPAEDVPSEVGRSKLVGLPAETQMRQDGMALLRSYGLEQLSGAIDALELHTDMLDRLRADALRWRRHGDDDS